MVAQAGDAPQGSHARLQLAALRVYAALTRPVGYLGMQRFSWLLGRLFGREASTVIRIGDTALLRVHLSDGYWTKLLFSAEYEPDVGEILSLALEPGTPFIDCGANIGYWSVLASREHGASVVAIEPARQAFERLTENRALNGDGFTLVRAALWSVDGETQRLVSHADRHAGASVVKRRERASAPGYTVEEVTGRSLDSLVDELFSAADRLVVKLDVEGAEAEALAGGRNVLAQRDVLVLYEDHGADDSCAATRAIMAVPGYAVHEWTDEGLRPVGGIDDVRARKTSPTTGYNFLAMRADSSFRRRLTAARESVSPFRG